MKYFPEVFVRSALLAVVSFLRSCQWANQRLENTVYQQPQSHQAIRILLVNLSSTATTHHYDYHQKKQAEEKLQQVLLSVSCLYWIWHFHWDRDWVLGNSIVSLRRTA